MWKDISLIPYGVLNVPYAPQGQSAPLLMTCLFLVILAHMHWGVKPNVSSAPLHTIALPPLQPPSLVQRDGTRQKGIQFVPRVPPVISVLSRPRLQLLLDVQLVTIVTQWLALNVYSALLVRMITHVLLVTIVTQWLALNVYSVLLVRMITHVH